MSLTSVTLKPSSHHLAMLCFLLLIFNQSRYVSTETDEDIVSIEETVDVRPDDSSEILDSNNDLMNSNDFDDIDGNNLTSIELLPQAIGLIEGKKSSEESEMTKTTANTTSGSTRIGCTPANLTENKEPDLRIVNSKQLLELVTPKGNDSTCTLVLFYYPWCRFSISAGLDFNAVGKLYPQLNVIAINAYLHNSINMRFGLVGVPTVLLLHKGKIVAKQNSTRTIHTFIYRWTGFFAKRLLVTEDMEGPLPIVPQSPVDYVLILSSVFLLITTLYLIGRSSVFKKIVASMRSTWRVAEAQHEHVD